MVVHVDTVSMLVVLLSADILIMSISVSGMVLTESTLFLLTRWWTRRLDLLSLIFLVLRRWLPLMKQSVRIIFQTGKLISTILSLKTTRQLTIWFVPVRQTIYSRLNRLAWKIWLRNFSLDLLKNCLLWLHFIVLMQCRRFLHTLIASIILNIFTTSILIWNQFSAVPMVWISIRNRAWSSRRYLVVEMMPVLIECVSVWQRRNLRKSRKKLNFFMMRLLRMDTTKRQPSTFATSCQRREAMVSTLAILRHMPSSAFKRHT